MTYHAPKDLLAYIKKQRGEFMLATHDEALWFTDTYVLIRTDSLGSAVTDLLASFNLQPEPGRYEITVRPASLRKVNDTTPAVGAILDGVKCHVVAGPLQAVEIQDRPVYVEWESRSTWLQIFELYDHTGPDRYVALDRDKLRVFPDDVILRVDGPAKTVSVWGPSEAKDPREGKPLYEQLLGCLMPVKL